MRIPLWSRLRLAPRIILVIVGGLLAVKAVDKAMPLLIRPPEIMFFDHDWLLDNLRDIRDRSSLTPLGPALLPNCICRSPIRSAWHRRMCC